MVFGSFLRGVYTKDQLKKKEQQESAVEKPKVTDDGSIVTSFIVANTTGSAALGLVAGGSVVGSVLGSSSTQDYDYSDSSNTPDYSSSSYESSSSCDFGSDGGFDFD